MATPATPASSPATSRARPHIVALAAALFALLHCLLAASASHRTGMTYDEIAHLTHGYALVHLHDHRLQPENGFLPQYLAGLGVATTHPHWPDTHRPDWAPADVWSFGYAFFYQSGNDPQTILHAGRAPILFLGTALTILIFLSSLRLWGWPGALLSGALATLSPTLLAHTGLATSDLAGALGLSLATLAVHHVFRRPSLLSILTAGAALTFALLAKYSGILIVPISLVLLFLTPFPPPSLTPGRQETTRRSRQALIRLLTLQSIALLAALGLWAAFGFRFSGLASDIATNSEGSGTSGGWTVPFTTLTREIASPMLAAFLQTLHDLRILPEAYVYGLTYVLAHAQQRIAFLCGQWSTTGWWWFYPYAFTVKSALGEWWLWLLAALGIWQLHRRQKLPPLGAHLLADVETTPADLSNAARMSPPRGRGRILRVSGDGANEPSRIASPLPWLVLLVTYAAAALTVKLNIGQRHLLPIYPALCILAGAAGTWAWPRRLPTALVAAGLLLLALENATTWPNYLTFFNQLSGGPSQGYRRLVDSSLDWGQSLPQLKTYLAQHQLTNTPRTPLYLAYFGTDSPHYRGIDAVTLTSHPYLESDAPPAPFRGGTYLISATILQSSVVTVMGPWTPALEGQYQRLRTLVAPFLETTAEAARAQLLAAHGLDYWRANFTRFSELRQGRLSALLRRRAPADQIAHSILVFHLTDADAQAAETGPAPIEAPAFPR